MRRVRPGKTYSSIDENRRLHAWRAKRDSECNDSVPEEKSSSDRRRLGHISKQGNVLLRFLLVEAAQVTVRSHQEWRNQFFHLAMRRGRKIAKVAMARKLAVHLYWMWRQGCNYGQVPKLGSYAGKPGHPDGVSQSPM